MALWPLSLWSLNHAWQLATVSYLVVLVPLDRLQLRCRKTTTSPRDWVWLDWIRSERYADIGNIFSLAGAIPPGSRERERERRFILHNTTAQLWKLWATTQSGGLPERHKAHHSWPPIVTKQWHKINLVQSARCKRHKCAQISETSSYRR